MSYKVIIVPSNNDCEPNDKWFPYITSELSKIGIPVTNIKYPDAIYARSHIWLPFIKELGADENTILIGHSSGAVAIMRFCENNKILGSILVSAYYTDQKDPHEKLSGYFDTKWDWEAMSRNQKWIIQFASSDDTKIPITEARDIHKYLNTEYYEYADQGHFGKRAGKITFPEIVDCIRKKIR